MSHLPQTGRYAIVNGREYKITRDHGWKLWTWDPASERDGFRRARRGVYERHVERGEDFEVIDLRYDATYHGMTVMAGPNGHGNVHLTTEDARAPGFGFEPYDRGMWSTVVPPDAPGLTMRVRRRSVRAPWADE